MVTALLPNAATPPPAPHPAAERNARARDRIAHCYDALFASPPAVAEAAALARLVGREAGPLDDRDVLDMGCATGFLPGMVRVNPERYLGLDPSLGMLGRARAKHPQLIFRPAYPEATGLPDACFDSVVSLYGALSYSPEPEAFAAEVRRLLRPGGRYLVMALGTYFARNSKQEPCRRHNVESAVTTWTRSRLRALFSGLGPCRVLSFSLLPHLLPLHPAAFRALLRLESSLLGPILGGRFHYQIVTGART